ncbi:MAG: thioredoxin family protein [Rhodocyclaceae bacterium]|nr:thioredoxin family protein [Rhodocyclaceae bacterium]
MRTIKILGSGCANCRRAADLIETVAAERGIAIGIEKVTDFAAIAGYGVMSTPGVVIDDTVVHAGGVPSREAVEGWFD